MATGWGWQGKGGSGGGWVGMAWMGWGSWLLVLWILNVHFGCWILIGRHKVLEMTCHFLSSSVALNLLICTNV